MSTWTLRQIDQVRGLRATAQVSAEIAEDALPTTKGLLADRLRHEAHPFAVEIDPGDVEFRAFRPDGTPWTVQVDARWSPTTNAVELRGGARDGEVFAIQRVGEPLVVPTIDTTPWWEEGPASEVSVNLGRVVYVLAGWSEDERHWVYAPEA